MKLFGSLSMITFSPIVTIEPRRRKFHCPIKLKIPLPSGYRSDLSANLHLLCSITGGQNRAIWEDVTGSTPLSIQDDCLVFTTTVSARFWLIHCKQQQHCQQSSRFAHELYRHLIAVPFMAKFVLFAKRRDINESNMRAFCMTDDKEERTLEVQEHYTQVAKSKEVEVLEGQELFLEFGGNLQPTASLQLSRGSGALTFNFGGTGSAASSSASAKLLAEQLSFHFHSFQENRLAFGVRVKDVGQEASGRVAFMEDSLRYLASLNSQQRAYLAEKRRRALCTLSVLLPPMCINYDNILGTPKRNSYYASTRIGDLTLADIAQELDSPSPSKGNNHHELEDDDNNSLASKRTLDEDSLYGGTNGSLRAKNPDWIELAPKLGIPRDEVEYIIEKCCANQKPTTKVLAPSNGAASSRAASAAAQVSPSLILLMHWFKLASPESRDQDLARALLAIGRRDLAQKLNFPIEAKKISRSTMELLREIEMIPVRSTENLYAAAVNSSFSASQSDIGGSQRAAAATMPPGSATINSSNFDYLEQRAAPEAKQRGKSLPRQTSSSSTNQYHRSQQQQQQLEQEEMPISTAVAVPKFITTSASVDSRKSEEEEDDEVESAAAASSEEEQHSAKCSLEFGEAKDMMDQEQQKEKEREMLQKLAESLTEQVFSEAFKELAERRKETAEDQQEEKHNSSAGDGEQRHHQSAAGGESIEADWSSAPLEEKTVNVRVQETTTYTTSRSSGGGGAKKQRKRKDLSQQNREAHSELVTIDNNNDNNSPLVEAAAAKMEHNIGHEAAAATTLPAHSEVTEPNRRSSGCSRKQSEEAGTNGNLEQKAPECSTVSSDSSSSSSNMSGKEQLQEATTPTLESSSTANETTKLTTTADEQLNLGLSYGIHRPSPPQQPTMSDDEEPQRGHAHDNARTREAAAATPSEPRASFPSNCECDEGSLRQSQLPPPTGDHNLAAELLPPSEHENEADCVERMSKLLLPSPLLYESSNVASQQPLSLTSSSLRGPELASEAAAAAASLAAERRQQEQERELKRKQSCDGGSSGCRRINHDLFTTSTNASSTGDAAGAAAALALAPSMRPPPPPSALVMGSLLNNDGASASASSNSNSNGGGAHSHTSSDFSSLETNGSTTVLEEQQAHGAAASGERAKEEQQEQPRPPPQQEAALQRRPNVNVSAHAQSGESPASPSSSGLHSGGQGFICGTKGVQLASADLDSTRRGTETRSERGGSSSSQKLSSPTGSHSHCANSMNQVEQQQEETSSQCAHECGSSAAATTTTTTTTKGLTASETCDKFKANMDAQAQGAPTPAAEDDEHKQRHKEEDSIARVAMATAAPRASSKEEAEDEREKLQGQLETSAARAEKSCEAKQQQWQSELRCAAAVGLEAARGRKRVGQQASRAQAEGVAVEAAAAAVATSEREPVFTCAQQSSDECVVVKREHEEEEAEAQAITTTSTLKPKTKDNDDHDQGDHGQEDKLTCAAAQLIASLSRLEREERKEVGGEEAVSYNNNNNGHDKSYLCSLAQAAHSTATSSSIPAQEERRPPSFEEPFLTSSELRTGEHFQGHRGSTSSSSKSISSSESSSLQKRQLKTTATTASEAYERSELKLGQAATRAGEVEAEVGAASLQVVGDNKTPPSTTTTTRSVEQEVRVITQTFTPDFGAAQIISAPPADEAAAATVVLVSSSRSNFELASEGGGSNSRGSDISTTTTESNRKWNLDNEQEKEKVNEKESHQSAPSSTSTRVTLSDQTNTIKAHHRHHTRGNSICGVISSGISSSSGGHRQKQQRVGAGERRESELVAGTTITSDRAAEVVRFLNKSTPSLTNTSDTNQPLNYKSSSSSGSNTATEHPSPTTNATTTTTTTATASNDQSQSSVYTTAPLGPHTQVSESNSTNNLTDYITLSSYSLYETAQSQLTSTLTNSSTQEEEGGEVNSNNKNSSDEREDLLADLTCSSSTLNNLEDDRGDNNNIELATKLSADKQDSEIRGGEEQEEADENSEQPASIVTMVSFSVGDESQPIVEGNTTHAATFHHHHHHLLGLNEMAAAHGQELEEEDDGDEEEAPLDHSLIISCLDDNSNSNSNQSKQSEMAPGTSAISPPLAGGKIIFGNLRGHHHHQQSQPSGGIELSSPSSAAGTPSGVAAAAQAAAESPAISPMEEHYDEEQLRALLACRRLSEGCNTRSLGSSSSFARKNSLHMIEELPILTEGETMRHMSTSLQQHQQYNSSIIDQQQGGSSSSLSSSRVGGGAGAGAASRPSILAALKRGSQDETTTSCSSSTSLNASGSPSRRRSSTVSQCSSVLSEGTRNQLNFDMSPDLAPDSSLLEANACSPTTDEIMMMSCNTQANSNRPASPEPSSLSGSSFEFGTHNDALKLQMPPSPDSTLGDSNDNETMGEHLKRLTQSYQEQQQQHRHHQEIIPMEQEAVASNSPDDHELTSRRRRRRNLVEAEQRPASRAQAVLSGSVEGLIEEVSNTVLVSNNSRDDSRANSAISMQDCIEEKQQLSKLETHHLASGNNRSMSACSAGSECARSSMNTPDLGQSFSQQQTKSSKRSAEDLKDDIEQDEDNDHINDKNVIHFHHHHRAGNAEHESASRQKAKVRAAGFARSSSSTTGIERHHGAKSPSVNNFPINQRSRTLNSTPLPMDQETTTTNTSHSRENPLDTQVKKLESGQDHHDQSSKNKGITNDTTQQQQAQNKSSAISLCSSSTNSNSTSSSTATNSSQSSSSSSARINLVGHHQRPPSRNKNSNEDVRMLQVIKLEQKDNIRMKRQNISNPNNHTYDHNMDTSNSTSRLHYGINKSNIKTETFGHRHSNTNSGPMCYCHNF